MEFKQTAFCLFTNKKYRQGQILQNMSVYVFIVSRHVCLKLSFQGGRKPTKMDANLSLLSHRIHICECTACACICNVLCMTNISHPTLPVRKPVNAPSLLIHHYFTYVKLQTPEGRRYKKKIFFEVSSTISLFKPTSSNLLNLA